ncbi:hypothetical protein OG453_01710 [Streptomyces sp. NBC_01381]|uniref:hypothetical protein n=1 Tax=Streptomyces sp. NBC_01381 TaxID=2903845 RepID=UPI00224F0F26|nr:hypothetical protein [Streptomyces sp. NBC_01381]MCX4665399.1 hypothetical protein [Streptomyces sp. NBC_01381]
MPRGRHRHSPPLHRLLPPSTVAGLSLVCAGGAWLFAEPTVLRGLTAAAAAAAVVGSVVMRRWDLAAGKQVAELGRARKSDEWRYDERIAECESDLDESRELRGRLETKLRAKRAELAALRNEHAALLRRYATAETERASALEGRRLLAIEASTPARALPPAPVQASAPVPAQAKAPESATPSLYLRANAALDRLTPKPSDSGADGDEARGKSGAADGYGGHERAVAVAPPAQTRRPVVQGGFDFFGTKGAAPAALEAVQNADLADVVGEEALALHKAEAESDFKQAPAEGAGGAAGQVIDLTAHDETEQIDVAELRTALRA